MRMVLDTNVWLDWLLFDDPSVRALAARVGSIEILATEAMLAETAAVLERPHFGLDPERRHALLATQRSLVAIRAAAPDCRLPCTDPNDQMFIDLAVAHRVDWLVSRDKALLRLRRHAWRRFGLRIGTPAQWRDAAGTPPPPEGRAGDRPADL